MAVLEVDHLLAVESGEVVGLEAVKTVGPELVADN